MGEIVKIAVDGRSAEGYFAEAGADRAGVIVIQEWWGLVDHIKSIVDRFARAGFNAFAPDLYHGQATTEPDMARKLVMELKLDSAAVEIASAAKFLKDKGNKGNGQVGVVGFCMGGSLAIWGASLVPEISAAVAFYPGASWERQNPRWDNFKGKFVNFHCSEGDGTSAAPGIQEAIKNIETAGGSVEAFDYPGTQHAFFNDERPQVYEEVAAKLAWQRTLDFFNAHL